MSTSAVHQEVSGFVADTDRAIGGVGDLPLETLRPLLEGARARGMADAFDLIGVPAVLIDAAGSVLHVGAGAAARMGGSISVASRHLVGVDASSNRALQDLVAAALAGESKMVKLKAIGDFEALCVRAVPMPSTKDNPYQLMKAIIVLDDVPKAIDEAAAAD